MEPPRIPGRFKVAERAAAPVVPIGALSRYDRPKPTLNGYDTLLEASS